MSNTEQAQYDLPRVFNLTPKAFSVVSKESAAAGEGLEYLRLQLNTLLARAAKLSSKMRRK